MKNYGLATPQVLLPNRRVNLKKWAVVACDQYNANPEYWERVQRLVGNNASTFHIILPEIYLDDDHEDRILAITAEMEAYVAEGVVEALPPGFVLVQRQLKDGIRTGLVAMIDLEKYRYKPTKNTLIRPTEQTVMERIPPRVAIRKPALLESPHILVLLNDPRKKVIEPLLRRMKKFPLLYDFDLMENGGKITGHFVGDKQEIDELYERLEMIAEENEILFAVGDGNHSLATAKAVWDEFKQKLDPKERRKHPKRFALVEVVNLFDEGLIFEPIHRVVTGIDTNQLISDLIRLFNHRNMGAKIFFKRSSATKFSNAPEGQSIDFIAKDRKGYILLTNPEHEMEAVNFQNVLDEFIRIHPEAKIEYIHGEDELARICEQDKATGFILPSLNKDSFIEVLAKHGVLPKKCFSLGEANEKRYYLETRLLDEIIEVDETHALFHAAEEEPEPEPDFEEETTEDEASKIGWLDQGNNEDIISMAFAEEKEDEELDIYNNEFLQVEREPNPEEYLSRRELKLLKRQQRIDELLGEMTADLPESPISGMLDETDEPPLSRRELKLLKRQQEYDYLLEQINKVKAEQAEEAAEQPKAVEQHPVMPKPERSEEPVLEEKEEPDFDTVMTRAERMQRRREEKARAREEMLAELEREIGSAQDEAEAEPQMTRREARALRRREKLEALLGEIDPEQAQMLGAEAETDAPSFDKESEEPVLSKSEQRRLMREEKRRQRLEQIEAWEREAEDAFNREIEEEAAAKETEAEAETEQEPVDARARKMKSRLRGLPEINEALSEDEAELDEADMMVSLEKARLRLEAEKIRLERFKIKEETKLQVQIERERQKAIRRAELDALRMQDEEAWADEVEAQQLTDGKNAEPAGKKKRRALSEILGDIVHEVKREEEEKKQPETVIVRRDTNEIIGQTFKIEHKQTEKKEKRRKGTILVKRAGNEYK